MLAGMRFEMIVVDASSPDGTAEVAERRGARAVQQARPGYANALRQGLRECRGAYVLALDADFSHRPEFVATMLEAMDDADIVIASRYVRGGSAEMPLARRVLSRALNRVFAVVLRLPYRDLSSGFRLYRASALDGLDVRGYHFDVLPEIVALAHAAGRRVREVPFRYHPREAGVSKARVLAFLPSYLRTLARCARVCQRT
jgi:dolichol-phosphate mannosyltransferase